MTFAFANPTQLWLEIAPESQTEFWKESQRLLTPNSRWRGYLNGICLDAFLTYLQEESVSQATVYPNLTALPSFWEVVNGTAIEVGDKRVILLPTEAIDDEELRVPQEWLDIPSWIGDYYLAIEVNTDDNWLRIWGYTSHHQLKTKGSYDPSDRTYCLDGDNLIQDLNILSLSWQLCPDELTRETVATLPTIPVNQAENLIQRLSNKTVIIPRLEVPFELWGSLLENDNWRQQIYQKRLAQFQPAKVLVNLSQWFENVWQTGWYSLETLFQESPKFAFSLRGTSQPTEITRYKLINFDQQLETQTAILLVGLTRKEDEQVSIRVQIHPYSGNHYLPAKIKLELLSESGEILKSVAAREQDNYIQLQRFQGSLGFRFQVQISLNNLTMIENFLV